MGIDMRTYGSVLQLLPDTDEVTLVELARDALLPLPIFEEDDAYWPENAPVLHATRLEHLFAAFNQIILRDSDGRVAAMVGYDDRHLDPYDLLCAVSVGLAPGSWYAYGTDYNDYLLVSDPLAETGITQIIVDGWALGPRPGPWQWADWCLPDDLHLPEDAPYYQQITQAARYHAKGLNLLTCYAGFDWSLHDTDWRRSALDAGTPPEADREFKSRYSG